MVVGIVAATRGVPGDDLAMFASAGDETSRETERTRT
jgi:hypothetical protein